MTDREAMLKALDALEILNGAETVEGIFIYTTDEIFALRQALAQSEQEPDAWRNAAIRLGEDLYSVGPNGYYDMTAKQWLDWALGVVNTAPPRKQWVGLTDDEINKIVDLNTSDDGGFDIWCDGIAVARIVCAKIKEKNT